MIRLRDQAISNPKFERKIQNAQARLEPEPGDDGSVRGRAPIADAGTNCFEFGICFDIRQAEKERFTTQLNSILEYMDKLKELETSAVEPTFHAVARRNVFREDQVLPSSPQDLALSNAPDGDRGFFRVLKIIE